ncbi:hypothetical protein [Ruminococcus albus]|uniref:DUF4430 domain-containing protein n=1 Tax=Ruminococcus albus TaxID=1264 RepID=A0A1H7JR97_RUMAL|nr:hypothetical protein [Ruminococcus albus]SEK77119.1 protein of unknown function [Ruminococcus albus]
MIGKSRKSIIASAAAALMLTAGAVSFAVGFYRNAPREDTSVGIEHREAMLPEISAEGLLAENSSTPEKEDTSSDKDESSSPESTPDTEDNSGQANTDTSAAVIHTEYSQEDTSPDDSQVPTSIIQAADDATAPAKTTPDGREADREYFTTSIVNGETVTDSTYFFTVTHLIQDLENIRCDVEVNSSLMTGFAGRVHLREGANAIRVSCTYKDADNKVYRALRDYTVYLSSPAAEIVTDLSDCEVYDPEFTFTARCDDGLEVRLNGRLIAGENSFTVTLSEGENMIKLTSGDTSLEFSVTYIPVRTLAIITDLCDCTVYTDSITFSAKAVGGNSPKLYVLVNGKALRGSDTFTAPLNEGNNTIRLLAKDGNDKTEQTTFTVTSLYTIDESRLPHLESISLSDNISVKGSAYTLTLKAADCDGARLYSDNIQVICGNTVPCKWEDASCTGYILKLHGGENTVTVKLRDRVGRQSEFCYNINCETAEAGEEVGRIQISVSADLIGLGTLCASDSFPVLEGETGFDTMVRFLEENGFEVSYRGSSNSRYLARISMAGRFAGAELTDAAKTYLAGAGVVPNGTRDDDSLGEFDYASGSGWMYSRNGKKPAYAMTSAVFADGEKVELVFSLDLGNDIGGE